MIRIPLTLLALLLPISTYAQEASPKPQTIDDRQIRARFEKELGQLKDDGKTPEPKSILKQLSERKNHAAKLPQIGSSSKTGSTASIYSSRKNSVLCFGHIYKCDKCDKWHGNIAGGFIITADGLAVTNYHVMESEKAGAFGAMTADGKVYMVEEVLAASKDDDLAIVRLAGDGFSPAPVKAGEAVGSKVVAISHPQGRFYTVSEGIISRYYKHRRGRQNFTDRMAITADFAKGSSGSPIFSADGSVVGVVSSTDSIYYDRDKSGSESNLQMVIKSCVPSSSILKLLSEAERQATNKLPTNSRRAF